MQSFIHTIGDSTLDNRYSMVLDVGILTAENKCVEDKVRELGHTVVSHAYHGFTTSSVLERDRIGAVLTPCLAKKTYLNEKAPNGGYVSPLEQLQEKISENPDASHYVVISLGWTDFLVNLYTPWRLVRDFSRIQNRYSQILERVNELQGRDIKPLLIFQYRLKAGHKLYSVLKIFVLAAIVVNIWCFTFLTLTTGRFSALTKGVFALTAAVGLYGSKKIVPLSVIKNVLLGREMGMSMMGGMLKTFYQPILNQAIRDRMPILDLSNTFNPYEQLYGFGGTEYGTEPNEEGGSLVADGIHHIVTHHNFSGESFIYVKPENNSEFIGVQNREAADWRVEYPSRPPIF